MRAAVVNELPSSQFELVDLPDPVPERPDDVVIAVEACGICGTDLHILSGESYRPALPFVLGHEPVGTVIATGDGARVWQGTRVAMTLFEGCGGCHLCHAGDERLCPNLRSAVGINARWGGFAEYVRVPAAQLVQVPHELPSPQAASLVDAGATAMNAVRVATGAAGEHVVVAGGGPVGFLVAEILSVSRARPTVLEANPTRASPLRELGYRVANDVSEVEGEIDCIVECTGSPTIVSWAVERLSPRATLVLAGYSIVPELDFAHVARKELTLRGIRSGSMSDLQRSLDLAGKNQIRLPALSTWPLDEIDSAFAELRRGAVPGKAIIVPDHHPELG